MGDLDRIVVVGAGVIGTSIALALRAVGTDVRLVDRDPASMRLAEELGAGTPWQPGERRADLAVFAVPTGAVAAALLRAQQDGLADAYTDVGSVKGQLLDDVRTLGCDPETFVGGHPLAGRERAGPAAARADLFLGRPWVLCPGEGSGERAREAARALVRACGAEPVLLEPEAHDRAVALVSHLPHVVASAAAARLLNADSVSLGLAGQGLRDTTRIAAGDPELWSGILSANARPVANVLAGVVADLDDLVRALRQDEADAKAAEVIADLLRRGAEGRARVPGKRGGPAPADTVVPVVISDQPGELGRLFAAAGEAGVNIEDVALEHSPGLPVGVVELSVRPEHARVLADRLGRDGWSVHGPL